MILALSRACKYSALLFDDQEPNPVSLVREVNQKQVGCEYRRISFYGIDIFLKAACVLIV